MSDLEQRNADAIASLRRVLVWCVSFVLLVLFALGGFTFYLRGQDTNRADEAKRLAASIQQSRYESVLRACEQDTARNHALIKSYTEAYDRRIAESTPQIARELLARRADSIAGITTLANAFLPKHTEAECVQRAQKVTSILPEATS